jgi:acyl-CoA thioester hydrolase
MADQLSGYPIIITLPVAWGEMDAFGHVNNIVYFRYFESARIAYLDAIRFRGDAESGGIGPILASTHCRFRRPLAYPDTVKVGARSTAVGSDRFTMEYMIVSDALREVVAEGGGVIVAYDYAHGRKATLPDDVRARIRDLEHDD